MSTPSDPFLQTLSACAVSARDASGRLSDLSSYVRVHVSAYGSRVESLLAYLQDVRFGRHSAATAAIQRLHRSIPQLQADVRGLESEWAVWQLLGALQEASGDCEAADSQWSREEKLRERFSQRSIAERVQPRRARERAVLRWLEHLSLLQLGSVDTRGGPVDFRRSLRRLQRQQGGGSDAADKLDPDVELRLQHHGGAAVVVFERGDVSEEERLLALSLALVRSGRMAQAVELCRQWGAHWRAASLSGGELGEDRGFGARGEALRTGNAAHRLLWRRACRALARAKGAGDTEAALYGALGGDLPCALRLSLSAPLAAAAAAGAAQHFHDALWACLRVAVDAARDADIAAEALEPDIKEDAEAAAADPAPPAPASLAASLSLLATSPLVSPAVHEALRCDPYVRMQRALLLDAQLGVRRTADARAPADAHRELEQEVVSILEGSASLSASASFLQFALHVLLYAHADVPLRAKAHITPNTKRVLLLLMHAIAAGDAANHALLIDYASLLDAASRVDWLSRFLAALPRTLAASHTAPQIEAHRQALLAKLRQQATDDALEITRRLVSGILEQEAAALPGAAQPLLMPGAADMDTTAATPAQPQRPRAITESFGGAARPVSLLAAQPGSGLAPVAAGLGGSGDATELELAKIRALDCFDVSDASALSAAGAAGAFDAQRWAMVLEGLSQATQLYRLFVRSGRVAAARSLCTHLAASHNRWNQLALRAAQHADTLPGAVSAHWRGVCREYADWALYVRCVNWHAAWLAFAGSRPVEPTWNSDAFPSAARAAQEYPKWQQKHREWQQRMQDWKDQQRSDAADASESTVLSATASFKELLQTSGGWLEPRQLAASGPRAADLTDIRQSTIPALVDMLMHIHLHSEEYQLALGVANLVASPLYALQQCFTTAQLRAFLHQCQQAYLKSRDHIPDEEPAADDAQQTDM